MSEPRVLICGDCYKECKPISYSGDFGSDCCYGTILSEVPQSELCEIAAELSEAAAENAAVEDLR